MIVFVRLLKKIELNLNQLPTAASKFVNFYAATHLIRDRLNSSSTSELRRSRKITSKKTKKVSEFQAFICENTYLLPLFIDFQAISDYPAL
jgi:hypothetical protein